MNIHTRYALALFTMILLSWSGAATAQEQTPTAVLNQFLQAAQKLYPPGTNSQPNHIQVANDTSGYWHMKERKARSSHGRSISLFILFRPTQWSIDMQESGAEATAIVTITIGNPDMLKLNGGKAEKPVRFSLQNVDGKWLLTRYEMQI